MAYKDGEVFESYCDKPYDRHNYKIILKNGKSIIYEDYEIMRYYWYQYRKDITHVEVLDAPKSTAGKGF